MTGYEDRWEPRAGGEEVFQRVEFVLAPLADGRQAGLDNSEVDQSLESAPAATGGALLDLDGSLVALGDLFENGTLRSVQKRRIMSSRASNRRIRVRASPAGGAAFAEVVFPAAGERAEVAAADGRQ